MIKANIVGFRLRLRYICHPSTSIKLFHSSFKKFCPLLRRSTHITTTHFQSVHFAFMQNWKKSWNIFKFRSNCARIVSRNFGKFRKMFGFRETEDLWASIFGSYLLAKFAKPFHFRDHKTLTIAVILMTWHCVKDSEPFIDGSNIIQGATYCASCIWKGFRNRWGTEIISHIRVSIISFYCYVQLGHGFINCVKTSRRLACERRRISSSRLNLNFIFIWTR